MAVYHFIEIITLAWSLDSVVSKYEEKQGFYSVVCRLFRSRCFLEYSTRFFYSFVTKSYEDHVHSETVLNTEMLNVSVTNLPYLALGTF